MAFPRCANSWWHSVTTEGKSPTRLCAAGPSAPGRHHEGNPMRARVTSVILATIRPRPIGERESAPFVHRLPVRAAVVSCREE